MKNTTEKEFLKYYYNSQKRKKNRKIIRKKKMANVRLMLFCLLIFAFILPKVFFETYDSLLWAKFRNFDIKIPENSVVFNLPERLFSNDTIFNKNIIASITFNKPLMDPIPMTSEMSLLKQRLVNLVNQNPSIEPGIFIYDFQTGRYVDIKAEKEFPTASIIKVPILFQLFRRAEMGLVNLNDKMTLTPYYITEGSGYLQYKPIGTTLSVYELALLMIRESDNSATNMLLSTVGGVNEINRALRIWGFSHTHLSNWLPDLDGTNVSTPKDLGTILYNIDNPDFLSIQSRAKIVEIMSHVKNRFLIQAGLPDSAQFIHKTGDIGTMLGDSGIVILPNGRKYIISVMVKRPWNSYAAKQFIIDASKTTYNSFASNSL